MNEIRVRITTMAGDAHEIEAPSDILVEDFLRELTLALALVVTDAEGRPINWRLDNADTAKTLEEGKTLEQNGVLSGHRLSLIRNTVAGGGGGGGSYERIQLKSKGKSLRRFSGRTEESIYGIEDGYLLIPQVVIPLLREHIESDPISKWFDRFLGFFLGSCVGFVVPALDDRTSPVLRGALAGASAISLVAVIVLIILEHKINQRRRRVILPLVERLSAEMKPDE